MSKASETGAKLPVRQLVILAIVRFAEPVAYASVFPYLPAMISDFGVDEKDVAQWAGITSAAFSLAQSITAVPWGYAADRFGRKPTLIFGLLSTMICFIVWGMSTSLPMALAVRAIQGGGNGNVGIIRTMVAEMVPQRELQPRAFSIMPLVWSLGSVVGPAFGGFFAKPAERFPDVFGRFEFLKKFPYALPNLIATVFFLISASSAMFFLKETLATKRNRTDWGLLVGQRLTRAFSRKSKRNAQQQQHHQHRRHSFVDGEATSPLVPSRPLPQNNRAQGSAKIREIFTYQTSMFLLAYSFLSFHSVAYDQNISVFLSYRVMPKTPDNFKPPFYFNGGFGLDPGKIGTIFTIYGVICGAIQFILYPTIVNRVGILNAYRICSIGMPIVYFITPYASLFATYQARFIAIISIMVLKAFCIIIAFPSVTILLTNSCTSLRVLSTLNGFATMFSALCRALGPASTGWVFSWGAKHGYISSAYFFLGLVAMMGAVPGFLTVEGRGPTADSSPAVTDDDDDEDEDEDDGEGEYFGGSHNGRAQNGTASSSRGVQDETQPLIQNGDDGQSKCKYRSIN